MVTSRLCFLQKKQLEEQQGGALQQQQAAPTTPCKTASTPDAGAAVKKDAAGKVSAHASAARLQHLCAKIDRLLHL